jgi:hypothetical protein
VIKRIDSGQGSPERQGDTCPAALHPVDFHVEKYLYLSLEKKFHMITG